MAELKMDLYINFSGNPKFIKNNIMLKLIH